MKLQVHLTDKNRIVTWNNSWVGSYAISALERCTCSESSGSHRLFFIFSINSKHQNCIWKHKRLIWQQFLFKRATDKVEAWAAKMNRKEGSRNLQTFETIQKSKSKETCTIYKSTSGRIEKRENYNASAKKLKTIFLCQKKITLYNSVLYFQYCTLNFMRVLQKFHSVFLATSVLEK